MIRKHSFDAETATVSTFRHHKRCSPALQGPVQVLQAHASIARLAVRPDLAVDPLPAHRLLAQELQAALDLFRTPPSPRLRAISWLAVAGLRPSSLATSRTDRPLDQQDLDLASFIAGQPAAAFAHDSSPLMLTWRLSSACWPFAARYRPPGCCTSDWNWG